MCAAADDALASERPDAPPRAVEWRVSSAPVAYEQALAEMEARAAAVRDEGAPELVWLLEHPALYTAGTSAKPADLLAPARFPVFKTGRGGQYTYHGPGQRVAYAVIDLKARGIDVRCYVHMLEEWVIRALAEFGLEGERRAGRVGIWIDRSGPGGAPFKEDKVAAIGVRVRRWVAFHGLALNVEPDLSHFEGIVPCGLAGEGLGVTSLIDLGRPVTTADADLALEHAFADVFGAFTPAESMGAAP